VNKDWLEKDFYALLGVSKDATGDEIKKKYRKLARELHPDKNPGDKAAEEKFKSVSEAYDVLSDDAKRKEYDEARTLFASGGYGPGGFGGGQGFGGGRGGSYNVNMEDLFGGDGYGDFLGGIFNSRSRGGRAQQPRRGGDIESELTLSFDDALDGVTVPLSLRSDGTCGSCRGSGAQPGSATSTCPTCGGQGQVARNAGGFAIPEPCPSCKGRGVLIENPCTSCRGSGHGVSTRTVQARIPAGVKDGAKIKLKGKGSPGTSGGPAGDLYINVHVTADAVFGRKGDSITVEVPITFTEAALGGEITVPTPRGGTVTLKVPAGTANGRTFRVREKGLAKKDGSYGDLHVTVEVAVPQNLSSDAKAALEEYAKQTLDHDPRSDLLKMAGSK
jgi:molecular chaperone DnaJ